MRAILLPPLFALIGCATSTSKSVQTEKPALEEKIVITSDTPVVHNDAEVVQKIAKLCPFTLIEMAREKIVRMDCDGTFAERKQSDIIKLKKKVKYPARGTWTVKDNELIFAWEGEPARGYTVDVMKDTLYIDGVDIKKKNATYKIDAPD